MVHKIYGYICRNGYGRLQYTVTGMFSISDRVTVTDTVAFSVPVTLYRSVTDIMFTVTFTVAETVTDAITLTIVVTTKAKETQVASLS